jgi:putative DNA primase/helicase
VDVTIDVPAFSEEALAIDAVNRYGADWKYVGDTNEWLQFQDGIWRLDARRGVFTLAREICRAHTARLTDEQDQGLARSIASAHTRASVVSLMANDPRIVLTHAELDNEPLLLGIPGGFVDLQTGRSHAPDRSHLITHSTNVAPTTMPCPIWENYLHTTLPICPGNSRPDEEVIEFLQRFMGYSLSGLTNEERFVFLQGTGRNGKDVWLETFLGILGNYGTILPNEALMERPNEPHRTELAELRGKRLVISSEVQKGKHWNQGRLKDLSAGGNITANRMRQDPITFKFEGKLWITGNNKPIFNPVLQAIVERLVLIKLPMTFVRQNEHTDAEFKQDPTLAIRNDGLKAALKQEWPGILAWTIEGTQKWPP